MNSDDTVSSINEAPATPGAKPRIIAAAPPATKRRHRANGKVARLPLEIRNLVNQALRDGQRYREIVGLLAAHGFTGINEQNLSNWLRGGYREWLAVQERFEAKRPLSDKAQAMLGQLNPDGRCSLANLNEAMLAVYFHELLEGFDAQDVAAKSEDFLHLAKALANFMSARAQRQRADLQRLQYELELRKIELAKKAKRSRRVVTDETLQQIEATTNFD